LLLLKQEKAGVPGLFRNVGYFTPPPGQEEGVQVVMGAGWIRLNGL
jgi:hypothetical protein